MKYLILPLLICTALAQANLCNSTLAGCSLCINTTNFCLSCNANYILINNTCLQCADGQYAPAGNNTSCIPCYLGCSNCNTTQCIACSPDYEFDEGSCSSCPVAMFSPGGTSNCVACGDGCLGCSYDMIQQQSICSNCSANYEILDGSCVQCGVGKYSNGGNLSCLTCPNGCGVCFGSNNSISPICSNCTTNYGYLNGSCSICPAGQVSTGEQSVCCPVGCSSCNGSECFSCSANYFFTVNSCIQCPNNTYSQGGNVSNCINCTIGCAICSNSGCLNCSSGFTLSPALECIQCNIPFCSFCSSSNICQTCNANFSRSIKQGLPICSCPSPFTLNTTRCLCLNPLTYNGSACLCSGANCLTCNSQDQCLNCTVGFIVVGENCYLPCTIPNCQSCEAYNQCVQCSNGMVPSSDSTACIYCNVTGCSSCQQQNNCTICSSQLILTVINNVSYCLTCNIANCIACSNNDVCATCGNGYILNNGSCGLCLFPCGELTASGSCSSCLSPFNFVPFANGTCFICNVPNCANCTDDSALQCFVCSPPFTLTSGLQCQLSCPANCISCNQTICSSCTLFYFLISKFCLLCPNAPQCSVCNASNTQQCLNCTAGFFNSNGTCLPCAIYCQECANASYCYTLIETYSVGFVLAPLNPNSNVIANCDPGCQTCQNSNPAFCLACLPGNYFTTVGLCALCTIQSYCMQCASNSPSTCLSCYPGSFLNGNQTCSLCSYNCSTCINGNPSQCTSCIIGFYLQNGSCLNAFSTVCGGYCSTCANNGALSCTACVEGAVLVSGSCVPCQAGCGVCSSVNISICLSCASGYYSNASGGCSPCPANCLTCNSFGCTSCPQGSLLNASFICTSKCSYPCVQCGLGKNPLCTQCIYGNYFSGNMCIPNETCNIDCTYCPLNTLMVIESTLTIFSQQCSICTGVCARCSQNSIHICTSCFSEYYLINGKCLPCVYPCFTCVSQDICISCAQGYVSLTGANTNQPYVNCVPCLLSCKACIQSSQLCTCCVANFTLVGTQCVSFFNFQVQAVLNADSSSFNQNYFTFLNAIANAAQVPLSSVAVLSVVYGSVTVTVTLLVSTDNSPASPAAIAQQNALLYVLSGSVAGMPVQSFSVTTNGGSNGNDDDNDDSNESGLSKTAIIIIAVFVPLIALFIIGGVVILYCKRKNSEQPSTQLSSLNTYSRIGKN